MVHFTSWNSSSFRVGKRLSDLLFFFVSLYFRYILKKRGGSKTQPLWRRIHAMFTESIWGIQNNIWELRQRVHHVWEEYLCAVVIIYNPRLEHLHYTGGGDVYDQRVKTGLKKTRIVRYPATDLLTK